jgi:hypothetical protein
LLNFWCCLKVLGFVCLFGYDAFMCLCHKGILVPLFNCLSLLWALILMIKHIDIPKNVIKNLWRLSSRAWYPNMNQRPKITVLFALFVLMLCGCYSRGYWASKSTIVLALRLINNWLKRVTSPFGKRKRVTRSQKRHPMLNIINENHTLFFNYHLKP